MIQVALTALLAWPVVALILCATLGPWRGVIATYLGAYLLLSGFVGVPMSGLPDYTKYTAATLGALIGILLFDPRRLADFRPRWWDSAVAALCLAPAASSLSNGLPYWETVSAVSTTFLHWGAPYFVGRLYADRPGAARDLALGLAVAGALMVVPIAFEVLAARSISGLLYGIEAEGGYKYGIYRTAVMATNPLEFAHWSALAGIAAFTLWCTGSVRRLAGVPFGYWAAAAVAGAMLCAETAARALMGLGIFLIALTAGRRRFGSLPEWAAVAAVVLVAPKLGGRLSLTALTAIGAMRHLRDRRPRLLIVAAALVAPFYLALRVTDAVSRRTLTVAAYTLLGPERGYSLEFRLITEELMIAHVMNRPFFGWGSFSGGLSWAEGVVAVDSLWIIQMAQYGLVGLAALYAMLGLPVVLASRRTPVEAWPEPGNAPVAALAVCLVVHALDTLLNAYILLPIPLIVGLTIALPAAVAAGRRARDDRGADRGLEQVERLAALGRPAEAEAACRRLVAARAADRVDRAALADACDRLADLLDAFGRPDEAEAPRRHALGLRIDLAAATPGDPGLREALAGSAERLARGLAGRGRAVEAVEARGVALEQRAALAAALDDPDALRSYADGLNDLAWLLAVVADPATRDPIRAVALAEQAVRVDPGRKAYWNTLGAAYRAAGEPGPAVAAARRSLRLGPDESGFDDALLASALAELGDSTGAREALARLDARLARLGPSAPGTLLRLRAEAVELLRGPSAAAAP